MFRVFGEWRGNWSLYFLYLWFSECLFYSGDAFVLQWVEMDVGWVYVG